MFTNVIKKMFVLALMLMTNFIMANDKLPNEFIINSYFKSGFFITSTNFDIKSTEGSDFDHIEKVNWHTNNECDILPNYHIFGRLDGAEAHMTVKNSVIIFRITQNEYVGEGRGPDGLGFVYEDGGYIEENVSFFSPSFKIFSPDGKLLGKGEHNFWNTRITITDPSDNHIIATIAHSLFNSLINFRSEWAVSIVDQDSITVNKIHPDLFVLLAAIQIDMSSWKSKVKCEERIARAFTIPNTDPNADLLIDSQKRLALYRDKFEGVEPSSEDFEFIESITELNDDVNQHRQQMEDLFQLLSTEDLSLQQNAALFLMLEHKLNQE